MAELIALFTTAKALGFDMTIILSMMVIALMLMVFSTAIVWKLVTPFSNSVRELTLSVKTLTDTLDKHVSQIDKRMDDGETRFKMIEIEIEKLKAIYNSFNNKGDLRG